MRFGRILFVIALLICIFEIARLWSISPEQMAAHFNAQGLPDRFVSKAEFFWFQIQTLFIVVLVSLSVQGLFLFMPPGMINMPNREYWLAPERKEETLGRLSDFGSMLFAVILLVILMAFEISTYANLQSPILFNAGLMGMVMVSALVVIILMLIQLVLSFRLSALG
ncbi:MAG: DUF1648 domain-containing protein [Chloroflexi bacterium]|nr:DUF1648 domain-containing protein [Chloroflexota bacterium]MBI3169122.1 DUF1648 domain-containing protein [Chloroflexota bacterium]